MRKCYFFIGTTAEFIKIFPILKKFDADNIHYSIISSGQNNITENELLRFIKKKPEIILSKEKIKQTSINLFIWFIKTFFIGIFRLKTVVKKNDIMVVHGDTISTVMGAYIGKFFGMKIAHVEAGLRSFNYLSPFPEEIDRILVSKIADYHFCQNEWAMNNIKNKSGIKINTKNNTLIDSLSIALKQRVKSNLLIDLKNKKYFIFILHRQENLFNKKLVNHLINEIEKISTKIKCVFVVHASTKKTLSSFGILEKIKKLNNIELIPRLSYLEFMHILSKSEFIITDGGSNQEESYYLGKPCLILRKKTERTEGIGRNVLISNLDKFTISEFVKKYEKYKKQAIKTKNSPSSIVYKKLIDFKI